MYRYTYILYIYIYICVCFFQNDGTPSHHQLKAGIFHDKSYSYGGSPFMETSIYQIESTEPFSIVLGPSRSSYVAATVVSRDGGLYSLHVCVVSLHKIHS